MITLICAFWLFMIIFGLIGIVRGWAKELLVTTSVLLALSILTIMKRFGPIGSTLESGSDTAFWISVGVVCLLVFFGYLSPRLPLIGKGANRKDQIPDYILGLFLGLLSGYMVVGTLWYFLNQTGYFPPYITGPGTDALGQAADRFINYLPPAILMRHELFAIAATLGMFVLIIVVFI